MNIVPSIKGFRGLFTGRVDNNTGGNDVESNTHTANNDQCELNGGRVRSSSIEIPSSDEEEDEKKGNATRIGAAAVAAPADTIAAVSTNDISVATTINTEKLQATHASIATTNIAEQTEPKSPSAAMTDTYSGPKYSAKKRRRKRSRGSPTASTTSYFSLSSDVNRPQQSISSPPNSNRKKYERKHTNLKKSPPKEVRVSRTKQPPLAITASMERATSDGVFDFPPEMHDEQRRTSGSKNKKKSSNQDDDRLEFTDDRSSTHTPSKSHNVPAIIRVKTGMKIDTSGHSKNQQAERDLTEVDVIQPPPKRQKLSKKSQEASSPCRNFPATKVSEDSPEIDSPVESTIACSSEAMKDSGQGNSSQQDEEHTPDKSTTNSTPESVKGSDDRNLSQQEEERSGEGNEKHEEENEKKIEFKLPRSLVPFNTPGVCDYGIIRTSRLRDRSKKTEQVDIAYQHIKGQTQCHATKEGRIWRSGGNRERCQNCAEGVFQFCHSHRCLDTDQNLYWMNKEKHFRATSGKKGSSATPANKGLSALKSKRRTTLTEETKHKSKPGPKTRNNKGKQCVFLKSHTSNDRCRRSAMKGENNGCCRMHARSFDRTGCELFQSDHAAIRCTALTQKGTVCSFNALDRSVFCSKHVDKPLGDVAPIVSAKKIEEKNRENPPEATESTKDDESRTDTAVENESEPSVNANSMVGRDPMSTKMNDLAPINKAVSTTNMESSREDLESREDIVQSTKHSKHEEGLSYDDISDTNLVSKRSVSAEQGVSKIVSLVYDPPEQSENIGLETQENDPARDPSVQNDLNLTDKGIEMESVGQQTEKVDTCNPPSNIFLEHRSHKEEEEIPTAGTACRKDYVPNSDPEKNENIKPKTKETARDSSLQNDLDLTDKDIEMESVGLQVEKPNECNPPRSIVLQHRSHQEEEEEEIPTAVTACHKDGVPNSDPEQNENIEPKTKETARDSSLQNDLDLTHKDIEMESVGLQLEKPNECNPPRSIVLEHRIHQGDTACDEHDAPNAENNKVHKNNKLEIASSNNERCFYVNKSIHCPYKLAEGDIFCSLCRICEDENKPFDHIVNDRYPSLNRCFNVERCFNVDRCTGKQCSEMNIAGEILCSKCRRRCGGMEESLFEICEDSDLSIEESSKVSISSSSTQSLEEINSYSSEESTDDDYDSDDSDEIDADYDSLCSAYTHSQFFKLWRDWEKKTEKTDEVEESMLIRKANNNMDPNDTKGQQKAQYGRVLPQAMKKMMKILELSREDVFLDIGHGIGNTCLHASFCAGCDSRGIEVVSSRHDIADRFRGAMMAEHHGNETPSTPAIGNIDLRLGRLEDPANKEFLTVGVTRAYVNNFNGVFADRSSKNGDKYFLDNYIAGIFASMAPGSIMVTFHPLCLRQPRDETNSVRKKQNMDESEYASFYSFEKILLGKACHTVKWNQRSGNTHDIFVYKYKRLHQLHQDSAVFLCSNPKCQKAIDAIPIAATTTNEDGRCVVNHCECGISPRASRRRESVNYS